MKLTITSAAATSAAAAFAAAALTAAAALIFPISCARVYAEEETAVDIIVDSFESGKLKDALAAALNGADPKTAKINRLSVSGGVLTYDDYEQFYGFKNVSILDLSGSTDEDNKLIEGEYGYLQSFSDIKEIDLPSEVTEIEDGTFHYFKGDTVIMPDTVKTIGSSAFLGSYLRKLTLPADLESIGSSAFQKCIMLESVEFPEKLKFIGSYAFSECTRLNVCALPSSVEVLEEHCFNGCPAIEKIFIGYNLREIGESSFRNCRRLTDVYIYAGTAAKITGDHVGSSGIWAVFDSDHETTVHITSDTSGYDEWNMWNSSHTGKGVYAKTDLTGHYTYYGSSDLSLYDEDLKNNTRTSQSEESTQQETAAEIQEPAETQAQTAPSVPPAEEKRDSSPVLYFVLGIAAAIAAAAIIIMKKKKK